MDSFFGFMKFLVGCGTLLAIGFVVVAHLPNSPLRTLLVQLGGWATAAICGAYVVSPIDVVPEAIFGPFGILEDIVAAIVGFMAARAAWKAGQEKATDNEAAERKPKHEAA